MRSLKLLSFILLALAMVAFGLYLYFNSDFVETRRLRGQIELNLGITLSQTPKSIYRENYGWAEEGGDKALLLLNKDDCPVVAQAMTSEEPVSEHAEYLDTLKAYGYKPASVKTWSISNAQGDSTYYALDASNCILYRVYHYE